MLRDEQQPLRRNIILGTEKKPKENFWALLVGVNHYDDSNYFSDLRFCINDVKALEETLKKLGYEVHCLHDELDDKNSPTRRNVKAKLNILLQVLQPDDLLWVHFSCYGTLASKKKEPVLILKDTLYSLLDDESEVLSIAQVENYMKNSGAHKLILTLDACHSGVNIGRNVSDQQEFFDNVHKKAEGFALLAAATANQKAYEDGKNGMFTHFLLQGLNSKELRENKNFITVYQLYSYVLNELSKWGVKNNCLQFPTQRFEGLGDIILAYYPENIFKTDLGKPVNLPYYPDDDLSSDSEALLRSADRNVDYTRLRDLLADGNWKKADDETYKVMIRIVSRELGDWIRDEELLNFPCTDLRTIDRLWVKYSDGRFGFSVQKKIYLDVGGKPDGSYDAQAWKKFGDRVLWRVEGTWINHKGVNFDKTAPSGHLPVGRAGLGWLGGWDAVYLQFPWRRNSSLCSLLSRLVNCNI